MEMLLLQKEKSRALRFTIKTNLGDTKTNLGDTKKGENGKLAFPKCCGGNNGKLPEGQFQSRLLMSKWHFGNFAILLPLLIPTTATSMDKALFFL